MVNDMQIGKRGVVTNFSKILLDPRLYFTIALFAGEAGPEIFKSSGWMYFFSAIGLLMMVLNRHLLLRRKCSIIILIYAVILLRNISTSDEIIYYYELPNFVTALLLLMLNCIYYRDEDNKQIINYVFIYSFLLAMLGAYRFVRNPSERLAVFGGPNGYYKIALLFEVLCFYLYQVKRLKVYLAGTILGLILCLATGSRGGIASMVIILSLEIFTFLFNAGEKRGYFVKRLLQIAIIVTIGYLAVRYAINRIPGLSVMFARANAFLYSDNITNLTSVNARSNLFTLGLQFFKESPLIGKGARYTYFYTGGAQPYPHNIFIEFLSENGIIGTIPLVAFFVELIIKTLKYGMRDSYYFCLFLCSAVYFSGSLFSGNVLDAKPIFVFGILLFNYTYNKRHCYNQGG